MQRASHPLLTHVDIHWCVAACVVCTYTITHPYPFTLLLLQMIEAIKAQATQQPQSDAA